MKKTSNDYLCTASGLCTQLTSLHISWHVHKKPKLILILKVKYILNLRIHFKKGKDIGLKLEIH